jgi:hypothetical protein
MALYTYDTPGAMARAYVAARAKAAQHNSVNKWDDKWLGGTSRDDALAYSQNGRDSYVAPAQAMLDTLDITLPDSGRDLWHDSIAGAYPNVPNHIAGFPDDMRRRSRESDETAPLVILVCLTSSAGIAAKTLTNRGIAILALTMAASIARPVQLITLAMQDDARTNDPLGSCHLVHIPSAPLSLAEAGFALCDVSFARGLGYGLTFALDQSRGWWPTGYKYGTPTGRVDYMNRVADAAGLPADRLCIPPVELSDDIVKNPTQWLRDRIRQYVHHEA